MCGIVSIVSDKPIEERLLAYLRDTLSHRGPDGYGQVIEKSKTEKYVGLAHRRLAIVDLTKNGHQPMVNQDESLLITFNGEIYNYKILKKELIEKGYKFKTSTDTEVLLVAYEAWGADMLLKLNGMFAFIIWDKRNQSLFIARDRFGEKPLYYAEIPSGGLIFASEVKTILSYPEIYKQLNSDKVFSFLQGTVDIEDGTFFNGIKVFPKASYVITSLSKISCIPIEYWNYSYKEYSSANSITDDTYNEFYSLVKNSIQKRLECDVNCAFYLSGGLDSSALCSFAAKKLHYGFDTFSIRFDDDLSISEGNYIDIISQDLLTKNFSYTPTSTDFLNSVKKLHETHEQPLLSTSYFLEYFLLSKVKEQGYKVIIDGQGSDELLGGYHFFLGHFQKHLINSLSFFGFLYTSLSYNRRILMERKLFNEPERRIVNGSLSFSESVKTIAKRFINGKTEESNFKYALYQGLRNMLPKQLHSADRNSMAFGIEVRLPFLDYNLVDFLMRQPAEFFLKDGYLKFPIRHSFKGTLDDRIRLRVNKLGFAGPEDKWLNTVLYEWLIENIKSLPSEYFTEESTPDILAAIDSKKMIAPENLSLAWRLASLNEFLTCNF